MGKAGASVWGDFPGESFAARSRLGVVRGGGDSNIAGIRMTRGRAGVTGSAAAEAAPENEVSWSEVRPELVTAASAWSCAKSRERSGVFSLVAFGGGGRGCGVMVFCGVRVCFVAVRGCRGVGVCQGSIQYQQGRMRSLAATTSQTRCRQRGASWGSGRRMSPTARMRRLDCQRKGHRVSAEAEEKRLQRANQDIRHLS